MLIEPIAVRAISITRASRICLLVTFMIMYYEIKDVYYTSFIVQLDVTIKAGIKL